MHEAYTTLMPDVTQSRLHRILQHQAGREAHRLGRLDLHRLAGAGIERLAGLGLVDREGPEGRQREPALLLQFGDNGPDQVIGGLGSGNAGAGEGILKNSGNEGFAYAGAGPCRDRFRKR